MRWVVLAAVVGAALAVGAAPPLAAAQTKVCQTEFKANDDVGWRATVFDMSTLSRTDEPAVLSAWETRFYNYTAVGLSVTAAFSASENAAGSDLGSGFDMQFYVGADRTRMAFEDAHYTGAEFWLDGKLVATLPKFRDGSSFPRNDYKDNFEGELADLNQLRDAMKSGRPVLVILKREGHGNLRIPKLVFPKAAANLGLARTTLRGLIQASQTGGCKPFRKPTERELRDQMFKRSLERQGGS
jgi:hypothetical protein